jgi:WD40 repeat protein
VQEITPEAMNRSSVWRAGSIGARDAGHGTGIPGGGVPGQRGTLDTISLSGDGRLMATASRSRNPVLLWALPSGRRVAPPSFEPPASGEVGDVAMSPDGRMLAVAHPSLGVEILDIAKRRHMRWLPGSKSVLFLVSFTPDGRFVVGGSYKGWSRLWSTETWRPVGRVLGGHSGEVLWQSAGPDGHTLATGSADGTVRLFDLRTQRLIGAPLPGVPNRPVAPQFSPDGAHLFAITDAGRAYRWDVRPSSWARQACRVAGRTLTRAEWNDVLPGRDYAPACTR